VHLKDYKKVTSLRSPFVNLPYTLITIENMTGIQTEKKSPFPHNVNVESTIRSTRNNLHETEKPGHGTHLVSSLSSSRTH
jgi:hypothetical protein